MRLNKMRLVDIFVDNPTVNLHFSVILHFEQSFDPSKQLKILMMEATNLVFHSNPQFCVGNRAAVGGNNAKHS